MLFHNVLCVCFLDLLASKIETNAQLNSQTETPDKLFADVIKNISRVNNELQYLINNYEQFKKTQNSLEIFDEKEDFRSDAEGGRVNRNNKNSVGNNKDKSDKTSTTFKFQTEMIYDDDDAEKTDLLLSEKSSESEKSVKKEKDSQSQQSNELGKNHKVKSREPIETTGKIKLNVQKTTTEASMTKEEPIAPKVEIDSESKEFLDIHKKMRIKPDKKKRIFPAAPAAEAAAAEQKKNLNKKKEKESDSSIGDQQTEEVDASKPKERAYEEDTVVSQVTAAIYLRSQTNESSTPKKIDKEVTDDEEALSKDLFQTKVLRHAYGDACRKLVVRKCFKACKSAYKSSCSLAVKCKSEMKEYFDQSSRTECIDAFNVSSKPDNPDTPESLRRIIGDTTLNLGSVTRDGYLSVVCQSQIEKPKRRMSNGTTIKNGEPLNILRKKYEKACQKISQANCGKACNSAQTAMCTKYECNKRLKSNFKRNCKTDCKIAFSNRGMKSSSSDGSGTGSDSDDSGSADSDSADSDSADSDSDDDGDDDDDDDDDDEDKS